MKEWLGRHLTQYLEIGNLEDSVVILFDCSRCFDANVVEIPVEVEGPDHHYYHVRSHKSLKFQLLFLITFCWHDRLCSTYYLLMLLICRNVQFAFFTCRKVAAQEELTWVSNIGSVIWCSVNGPNSYIT